MTMIDRVTAALNGIQASIAELPEQLQAMKCAEMDFCSHIEPLITANYVLSAIIKELDHDACSKL
ncbi:MAG: hypothetical protein A2X82_20120 [Geobacteraceae bacterium GWC2_55_20]|nr:MAG: hypothetical protein A2X82_20120 [Geobacteraceae bacterium GWC2_55_20]OGU24440.1 MAG: hypothetical protein A2X85_09360 [Geobacteraceae bacterium GWF2_54_21]HCE68399.1 hypothetical protein [Geobacter sp.]